LLEYLFRLLNTLNIIIENLDKDWCKDMIDKEIFEIYEKMS